MKRTPLRRRKRLRAGAPPRRRTPLRSRPSSRARPDEPLATWCEAAIGGVCTGRAQHRHHRLRRSQGGGDEKANTADLCLACHDHIHAHPAWSYAHGWLRRTALGPGDPAPVSTVERPLSGGGQGEGAPPGPGHTAGQSTDEAKAVCAGCTVREQCLEFAFRTRQRHGIWGRHRHTGASRRYQQLDLFEEASA